MNNAFVDVICIIIQIARWGLIIWIVLSWVVGFGRLGFDHPVRRFYDALSRGVEPILRPIRNVIPPLRVGGAALDLSPLVLFFGLIALEWVIC